MTIIIKEFQILNKPIQEVFTFLTQIENFIKWQEGLINVELLDPGPWKTGTKIKTVHHLLLWKKLIDFSEITEFHANHYFCNKGSVGKTFYDEEFRLSETNNGTRLDYCAKISPSGIFKLISPLAKRAFGSQMKRSFAKLKRVIEC